jgi:MATE family multidrug resistance protein
MVIDNAGFLVIEHNRTVRRELKPMLRLAGPVIVAELGWVGMGIVDTIVVGPLGPAAIGAVGTGSTLFFSVSVLGMGTLLALDTFVAQSFGAGRVDDCHRWLFAGIQLAAVMSIGLVAVSIAGVALLPRAGLHADVIVLLQPYLRALLWSAPPLLLYTVFRRYLQAMNAVRPVMVVLVTANLINAAGNWALIYGHLGAPALGVVGSAYATLAARLYMAGALWIVILLRERTTPSGLHDVPFAIDAAKMWRLVTLGLPAAVQIMLEVGVFAAVSTLAATIAPLAVAANQIVLNIASFFFMVPYGLSSAAAVRVGQAFGRRDPDGMRAAGWTALALALVFAGCMSIVFSTMPRPLLRIFTTDASLLRLGVRLLLLCALFQAFDGFQTVSTGALRGLAETRLPMIANLVGHWFIGLPLAYFLCFTRGWGVLGLWTGLSTSLMLIGTTLLVVWHLRSRAASSIMAAEIRS